MRTASLAYDAVALVAALVKTQGKQRFATEVLTNASGFTGLDGLFRFRPDGTNQRGLAVLRVSPTGGQMVSPPPKGFAGQGTVHPYGFSVGCPLGPRAHHAPLNASLRFNRSTTVEIRYFVRANFFLIWLQGSAIVRGWLLPLLESGSRSCEALQDRIHQLACG